MKTLLLVLSIFAIAALPGCTDSEAKSVSSSEPAPENGAQFKKGEGLSLTDEMTRFIGLRTEEVSEEKVAPRLSLALTVLPGGKEASGWLPADQAAKVQPGQTIPIPGNAPQAGSVQRVDKAAFAAMGDFEITVGLTAPLAEGVVIQTTVELPAGEAVATVPTGALLKTAEGHFVYAKNGKFFVRTPVKVGTVSDTRAEIIDGLYSGDEVVTAPVMSLWMAELQVLRGGKACTCGH